MAYAVADGLSPPISSGSSAQSPEYLAADSPPLAPAPLSSQNPVLLLRPSANGSPADVTLAAAIKTEHGSPPLPVARGPLNGTYHVPPRPKPGRKTVNEVPPTKRKQQNREAQRSFRARRQQQKEQLEKEVLASKKERDDFQRQLDMANQQLAQQERVMHGLRQRCETAESSVTHLTEELSSLRSRLEQSEKTVREKDDVVERLTRQIRLASNDSKSAGPQRTYSIDPAPPSSIFSSEHRRPSTASYPLMAGSIVPRTTLSSTDSVSAGLFASLSGQRPPDGCDNCTEDRCPCVEQFTNVNAKSSDDGPAESEAPNAYTISSILTPQSDITPPTTVKDSPEDREIDFTNFFKPATQTVTAPPSIGTDSPCGFCTDPLNCQCKASHTTISPTTIVASSVPTLVQLPPRKPKRQPGTCPQCQANPEQKRFCEELSRRRTPLSIRDMTNPSDSAAPSAKRPRLDPPVAAAPSSASRAGVPRPPGRTDEVKITCAEAFQVFQSYRETEARQREREREEEEEEKRRFSAFEIGVGEALMAMAAMKSSGRKGRDVEMGEG